MIVANAVAAAPQRRHKQATFQRSRGLQDLRKTIILFFATGTFLGYSPLAPGTIGTLWGIPMAYGISVLGPGRGIFAVVLTVFASILFAGMAKGIIGGRDPGSIVCDEVAGFVVAAFMVPFTPLNMILAFILFRIFDILKPFPIGILDRRIKGGAGIVLDDVAAGIYANICVHIITGIVSWV